MDHPPHDMKPLDEFAQRLADLRIVPQSVDRDQILFRAGQQSVRPAAAPRRFDMAWRLTAIGSTSAALLLGFLCWRLDQARTAAVQQIAALSSAASEAGSTANAHALPDAASNSDGPVNAAPSTRLLDQRPAVDRWAAQPAQPSLLQIRNRLLQLPLDELATITVAATVPGDGTASGLEDAARSPAPFRPRLSPDQIHDLLSPEEKSL